MGFEERRTIIEKLQTARDTKIVTHVLSDRRVPQGLPVLPALITKLGTEAQPYLYQILQELGKHSSLDLFLYTRGGQVDSVWPLVSLFREFGEQFNVLVPYKAHSAGTLICLGANTIVMGEAGELSPVDPQTGNQYNPIDELSPQMRKGISVEDVSSYFDLARDLPTSSECTENAKAGIDPTLAFQILAQQIHPLALGGVNRSHKQIRELARRLLCLHCDSDSSKGKGLIERIVNVLTQGRYSHTDVLNRREARDLLGEEIVKFPNESEQKLLWGLFHEYENALSLDKSYILQNEIGDDQQTDLEIAGAFLETENTSYIFRSALRVTQKSILPPNYQLNLQAGQLMPLVPGFPRDVNVELREMGWFRNERGL